MNAIPLGSVLICDATETPQWRIATCDEAFSELSGVSFHTLLGRDLHTILHPAPVLHDTADRCRLQHSTHWFAYAPDLPPVVMTTTILPDEVSVQAGTVPGQLQSGRRLLVACHFSRRALPALGSQTSSLPASCVPCSPIFYDTASYDKSLYVHTWSMATNANAESPSRSQPAPPRFKNKMPSSSMSSSRKPPLAPDPPRSRCLESASCATCAVTCTTSARSKPDPSFSCPPSSQTQQEILRVAESPAASSLSNLQCAGEGASAHQSGTRPRPQQGNSPSIPNEMGSRSLFLANMSHELRTPLNGTVAIVELLLGTNVSPEQRDLLKTVLESSQSLTRILSSILDFAQLDSGLVELSQHPLNICDIVESCIDMVWPDALKKGLEVTVSAPRVAMVNNVLGDGLRIRQILVHLLSNAVKFTDQGSVEVEVEAEETATDIKCALKVKDTGIGVPDSFRPFLFDSFTQATESCTRTHGGLGLGLAICCNLARLMHADLKITNREGGGSTATLSLCMSRAATSVSSSSGDQDLSTFTAEGAEPKDGLQSPTFSSSIGSRNSLDSTDSSGCAPGSGEKSADSSSHFESRQTSISKDSDMGMCLQDSDISIPKLLADSRVRLLQRHTAVIHTYSMGVSQQLRCALSALGMAVIDMPVMRGPQSLDDCTKDQHGCDQLRGTPILFCSATDAAPALRSGWKKRPVVALCADGRLPHALRVYVTPVAMPVKFRDLTSAALLALHGGPGKDSLLHVPLGTPKPVAATPTKACTAGFGGTSCGFCTRCQRTSDAAAAAALHRRSLDNSALERFPQRLSMSAACLEAVVEGNDSSYSCHSCASSESGWAATENSALDASRSENSSTSMGADSRAKAEFVLSAGTESDASGMARSSAAAGTSSAGSLQQQGDKTSLESYKLPLEALSGDSSTSPVRPADKGKAPATAVVKAPAGGQHSVCAATAVLGAHMQQQQHGTCSEPVFTVPVLAANSSVRKRPGSTAPTMRRSISASGISKRASGERMWQHQQQHGQANGGVAMQSFLYRSAKQESLARSGDASSSGVERGRGSSCLESEAPSPRSPLHPSTQQPGSTTSGKALPAQGSPKAPTLPKAGAKRLRLLVAEDNKINQLVVQKVVRKAQPMCDIDVVENGEAALLAILERPGYDLVLMDIHMPKMDGLETTRRVRESHPTRPMIVALTADTVVGMRQKCLQAGMQDYITKPFHVKDMHRILQHFQP